MPDKISKELRSRNMRAIKSKGTKLEEKVTKGLWSKGFRFRKNVKDLYGKPDLAIKKYKIAIFLDSCFWHCCPQHGNLPKTNKEFWENKLNRNVQRDRLVTNYYIERNWHILRIWEHEVKADADHAVDRIAHLILQVKKELVQQ